MKKNSKMSDKVQCTVCIDLIANEKMVVECFSCQYKACQGCVKTYLLQSLFDAHCMNCRCVWTRDFLLSQFPRSFVLGAYKHHRSAILFEREKSYFPQTMECIQRDEKRRQIQDLITRLQQQKKELEYQLRIAQQRLRDTNHSSSSSFQRSCATEECKGYIDTLHGHCPLCQQYTCLSCNVLIGTSKTDHLCREEDRLNWEHISSHTQPCPTCQTRIHRISGCNQMWCPQCHTAFHYTTNEIVKGTIHNPHYLDFVKEHGHHALLQQPTRRHEGLPSLTKLLHTTKTRPDRDLWHAFHQVVTDIRQNKLPRYQNAPFHTTTLSLRKQYLQNHLSESMFKKKIQEREKKWLKDRECWVLYDTFYTLGVELLRSLALYHQDPIWKQKIQQRQQLRCFFNNDMKRIANQYQSVPYQLTESFQFIRVGKNGDALTVAKNVP